MHEKRIPTILGLIVIIGGVFASAFISKSSVNYRSGASGDCKPINPQITNITHNSFDVSFVTVDSCMADINVDNRTISDVRFVDTNVPAYKSKVHYFQVNNIKEKTDYIFSFINNGQTYEKDTYRVKTGNKPPGKIPTSNLAWGKVFNSDMSLAKDAIVYLNIPGASPLSSFVTDNGYWSISLAISFNDAKNNWFSSPANVEEDIVVISSDGKGTQVVNNTSRNNPVPNIVIGKNIFSSSPLNENEKNGNISDIQSAALQQKLEIKNPKLDGETLTTFKPDFFGTAPLGIKIILEIQLNQIIQGDSLADAQGIWHWSPPQNLTLGEHVITASITNSTTGLIEKTSRKFLIMAQDNSLAFTSSSSAILTTPIAIISPTSIPTPRVSSAPTTTPKQVINTPRPTNTATQSASMPVSGVAWPTFLIVVASMLLVALSVKL